MNVNSEAFDISEIALAVWRAVARGGIIVALPRASQQAMRGRAKLSYGARRPRMVSDV